MFDSSGNLTQTINGSSTGTTGTSTKTGFSVSSDGVVTRTGSSFHGIMSSDKNIIVFTGNDPGQYWLSVLVKAGASFSQADLTGNWVAHGLAVNDGANYWMHGNVSYDASGVVSYSPFTFSDGTTATPTSTAGNHTLASSGILTHTNYPTMHGVMTPSKDVFITTHTASMNGNTTYNLTVYMKR